MYLNKLFVSVFAVCTTMSLVGGSIFEQIGTEFQTFVGLPPAYKANLTKNGICFDYVGCFKMDEPWLSRFRPIPPPLSPEKYPVTLFVFTRQNLHSQDVVNTYPEVNLGQMHFDCRKPTFIIIHGFINNGHWKWMHVMKDVLLSKKDGNVILVDWGPGAQVCTYLQAVANTRMVARLVTRTLLRLMVKKGLKPGDVHLIGHSLGAHISSYIGKAIPGIKRITAMDPAQPAFEGFSKEIRLDKSDAKFVEVIHTDGKPFMVAFGFGMMKPHGHVDFYMNGGAIQPGCVVTPVPKIKNLAQLALLPMSYICSLIVCNHGRSIDYTIHAFNKTNGCTFWGRKLAPNEVMTTLFHTLTFGLGSLPRRCTTEICIPFGLETIKSRLRGSFIITTSGREPFCLPELAPLNKKIHEKNWFKKPCGLFGNHFK